MINVKNHTTGEMKQVAVLVEPKQIAELFGINATVISKHGRELKLTAVDGTIHTVEIYAADEAPKVEAPKLVDGRYTITVVVDGQSASFSHSIKNGEVFGHPYMIKDLISKATSGGRYNRFYLMDARLDGDRIHITFRHNTEAGRIQSTVVGKVIGDLSHWIKPL